MEQRLFPRWTHLWRDALIALTATLIYFIIQYFAATALPDILVLLAAAIISLSLTLIGDALSKRHALRCAVITFSQRSWFYLFYAGLASCATAGVLALLWLNNFSTIMPFATSPLTAFASAGAVCVVVGLLVWVICYQRDHVTLTAAQCYVVLRRIIRQWATGKYVFDYGATRTEIRQESRFLDYLVRQSHKAIRHKHGGYVFEGGRNAHATLKQLCEGALSGQLASSIQCANAHWARGKGLRNRWRNR